MSVIGAIGGKNKESARSASLVVFVADEASRQSIEQSLRQLGISDAYLALGGIDATIEHLGRVEQPPKRLIVDISGIDKPLDALDDLADACDPSVQVYVLGDTNDVTLYRALLQAGIADYRFKPLTVDALRLWVDVKGGQVVRQTRSGKVISIVGTRGGVGVTSVAAHLASQLTAGSGLRRVVYLDMNFYGGTGATLLSIAPNHAMSEVLQNINGLDPQFLERILSTNDGRVFMLGFNQSYADSVTPASGAMAQLLEVLSQQFHYVVVDMSVPGGAVANEVLALTNITCILSDCSVYSARALTRLLSHAKGRANAPVLHVLTNSPRSPERGQIDVSEFAQAVSHPVAIHIPYDGKYPAMAEDLGEPLQSSSELAKAVGKLARLITGELSQTVEKKSRFAHWFRRPE